MPVSEKEQQQINSLVRRFEAETGIEAVAAVVGKADAYPEIPWKAYAIGSAFGALAAVFFPFLSTHWDVSSALAFAAIAILGAGAVFAAGATLVPALGRLFLDGIRAQAEARQCALALFVEREVFRARERCAVLMLVTRFERVAVILPDAGLAQYAPPAELARIARAMRDALVTKGAPAAFESAFTAIETLVKARGFIPHPTRDNALEDAMVAEKGL